MRSKNRRSSHQKVPIFASSPAGKRLFYRRMTTFQTWKGDWRVGRMAFACSFVSTCLLVGRQQRRRVIFRGKGGGSIPYSSFTLELDQLAEQVVPACSQVERPGRTVARGFLARCEPYFSHLQEAATFRQTR